MNWDDYRFVLAIERSKTLSAAARHLNVNQTTVARRLTALEDRLGTSLFLRTRSTFVPTETGDALILHAERMETEALAIAEDVSQMSSQPHGLVRVATMPWIFNHVIVPALPDLLAKNPGITVQAITGLRERNLGKREAELALRFEMQPHRHEESIPLTEVSYSLYAPAGLDPDSLPWVGYAEEQLFTKLQDWQQKHCDSRDPFAFQANEAETVYLAVRNGLGKGLIPHVLAEGDEGLQRLSGKEPEMRRELKALVHEDMLHVARVRVFIDWVQGLFSG